MLVQPDALVAKDIDEGTLVLVALMEEDVNADIVGTTATKVEKWMRLFLEAFSASGANSPANLAKELIPEFRKALDVYRTNDDILGIKHLSITKQSGDLNLSWFTGDGARYKVRFAMTPN